MLEKVGQFHSEELQHLFMTFISTTSYQKKKKKTFLPVFSSSLPHHYPISHFSPFIKSLQNKETKSATTNSSIVSSITIKASKFFFVCYPYLTLSCSKPQHVTLLLTNHKDNKTQTNVTFGNRLAFLKDDSNTSYSQPFPIRQFINRSSQISFHPVEI